MRALWTWTLVGLFLGMGCAARAEEPSVRSIAPVPGKAVVVRGESGVVLRNLRIEDDRSIDLRDCSDVLVTGCDVRSIRAVNVRNLRIVNSYIHDSPKDGITVEECSRVLIQGNRFERVGSGVYALSSTWVRVIGNYCRDVRGPMPRGQLAQFDKVYGEGNQIRDNIAVNYHGASMPEDCISLYKSTGTARSPIRVENNFLVGDPWVGSQDKSDSGSGIMLGDGGGRYQQAIGNVIVDAGQVGIGVAGGGDILVKGNTVLGRKSNVSNVGIYVWNLYKRYPSYAVRVESNRVAWTNAKNRENPYWEGGGFPSISERDNIFGDQTLRSEVLTLPSTAPLPPKLYGSNPEVPYSLSGRNSAP